MAIKAEERLQSKVAKLEAQLAALREKAQAHSEKRYTLTGRIVLAEAEKNPDFREQLTAVLDRAVKKKGERTLLGLSAPARRRRRTAPAGGTPEEQLPSASPSGDLHPSG